MNKSTFFNPGQDQTNDFFFQNVSCHYLLLFFQIIVLIISAYLALILLFTRSLYTHTCIVCSMYHKYYIPSIHNTYILYRYNSWETESDFPKSIIIIIIMLDEEVLSVERTHLSPMNGKTLKIHLTRSIP